MSEQQSPRAVAERIWEALEEFHPMNRVHMERGLEAIARELAAPAPEQAATIRQSLTVGQEAPEQAGELDAAARECAKHISNGIGFDPTGTRLSWLFPILRATLQQHAERVAAGLEAKWLRSFAGHVYIKSADYAEICDERNHLRARVAELEAERDRLLAGYPEGLTPADVRVMKEANWKLGADLFAARAACKRLNQERKDALRLAGAGNAIRKALDARGLWYHGPDGDPEKWRDALAKLLAYERECVQAQFAAARRALEACVSEMRECGGHTNEGNALAPAEAVFAEIVSWEAQP